MFMYKSKTWFDVVQAVVKNRNTSVNWELKVTPNELFKMKNKKEIKLVYDKLVEIKMKKLRSSKSPLNKPLKKRDKVRKSLKKEEKKHYYPKRLQRQHEVMVFTRLIRS